MRFLGALLLIAVIGVAGFAYDVKYRTSSLAREAASLENQIAREQALIATLRAEWSALNQPARLQALATRHLPEFKNASVQQMAFAYDLPERALDLGKFISTLDAQPGLETPIDKKVLPASAAMPVKPAVAPSVKQATLPSVPVVRAAAPKSKPVMKSVPPPSPMPLMPSLY